MAGRLEFRTRQREEMLDITDAVRDWLRTTGVKEGVLHLWSLHTTCALTVNEGADPDVRRDMVRFMNELVPADADFQHAEGNSDSHIKTSLFGPGLTLIIEDGEPLLGTWQSIYLAEWDGPRRRTIALQVIPAG